MGDGTKKSSTKKMIRPTSLPIIVLVPLSIVFLFFGHRFLFICSLPFYGIFIQEGKQGITTPNRDRDGPCSNMEDNSICCDRTDYHSDICFMRGDVRTHSSSSPVLLFSPNANSSSATAASSTEERIRPYTRKWESVIMDKIPELRLKIVDPKDSSAASSQQCDVRHNVTALFFSLGGYTGNIFHAFSNGIIPLYITSQHLNRQVVFVILEYRYWWYTKYQEILSQLSNYPVVDLSNDTRMHCFPNAVIGLEFHGTLSIDSSRTKDNKSICDFHNMLDEAYKHRIHDAGRKNDKPKLVMIGRNGTRAMQNEGDVVKLAMEIGFDVEVLRPKDTMPLSAIYRSLSACDVMMGVHGAALTHFLFMRPKTLFIQVVPLGLEELAQVCFGNATAKAGIKYEDYKISPRESSLYLKYGGDDPMVRDPNSVKAKGWEVTKRVYLEGQNVTLDVGRLRDHLERAFQYASAQKSHQV